ncbi:AAA family ATPase [Cryobacterium lyxosi]|nr:AAA family ATPase [Cryobacterium lyxosi]
MVTFDNESFEFLRSTKEENAPFTISANDAERLVRLATSETFTYPTRKPSRDMAVRVRRALSRLDSARVDVPAVGNLPGPTADINLDAARQSSTHAGLEDGGLRRGTNAIGAVTQELEALFRRMVYLGPLRQPPLRVNTRQDANRVATDIPFFLLDNSSEREEVSSWMRRLGVDYDLDVLNLANAPGAHVLGDIATVVLRNERKGVSLSTADVGFGVSQVLPILVELSARTESIILIEQPEIHLHPAMQSELADLLIESTDEAGRGNQIIAETHSEHIMLRVQRRIREGQFDPAQVAVLYVDQRPDGSAYVKELRLDSSGDFIDEWPNGFFSERFDEVFSGVM